MRIAPHLSAAHVKPGSEGRFPTAVYLLALRLTPHLAFTIHIAVLCLQKGYVFKILSYFIISIAGDQPLKLLPTRMHTFKGAILQIGDARLRAPVLPGSLWIAHMGQCDVRASLAQPCAASLMGHL